MMQVLLIDDDAINNIINKRKLRENGIEYPITEFLDSQKALDFIGEKTDESFLILLDLNMPLLNGWELLDTIKAKNLCKLCKVVILSSSVDDQDIMKSQEYEMVKGFISKPLNAHKCGEIKSYL